MEYPYTAQLINNLSIFYKDSDIEIMHYPHIKTIRIILPANANLKNFANNLFNDLEKLPEIDFPREMVYFWMCQIGSANFYKELINPTKQAELDWKVIGTGPDTWVLPKDLGKC
jgi:hypothetical protein